MRLPSKTVLNIQLTAQLGKPVVMLDVVPVAAGERLHITFASQSGEWRQGIWIAVDGELEIAGQRADQMEIWTDTVPPAFNVEVVRTTDGLLRLYNIWDSGRGRRRESQSATSGMLKETIDRTTTYRCNDIGTLPNFDKIVFEIRR
jgi:hypothetical protein